MAKVPGEMLDLCLASGPGFKGLDTAYMYCGGKSETMLGEMPAWKGAAAMATKVMTKTMGTLHCHLNARYIDGEILEI